MVAMGMLPDEALEGGYTGHALGLECAGRIVTVGADVTGFKPGDRVMALTPHSFGSYVTADAGFVVPLPAQLSFEEAATIPTAFFTAYYCLHHLGRLREGERILIHAAAGGVGLAAVQVAQQLGAEIFATAGSPEKREFLRALGVEHVMDSRSLDFADDVMERTGGKGIDIVLNSLAGEAIPKSLSILAAYGRFIEIGKQDIYNNTQLGLRPFRNNLAYFAVDIDRLWRERPDEASALFREMMRLFADGSLHPLPHRVFPLSQATHAFRHMAQARHIGKIVITNYQLPIQNRKSKIGNSRATYLITGGLGGFGLATAQWLVQQGARHLVLLGRSGASTPAARSVVESMQAEGVEVMVAKADVTQVESVADVLGNVRRTMPPLRGIIHAR